MSELMRNQGHFRYFLKYYNRLEFAKSQNLTEDVRVRVTIVIILYIMSFCLLRNTMI